MKKLFPHSVVRVCFYFSTIFFLYSCSEEEEIISLDEEVASTQFQVDHITSQEELTSLLINEGLEIMDLTPEEKMNFLSEKIAQEYIDNMSTARFSGDQFVCVAQIFDGTNYFTDVDSGIGACNASIVQLLPNTSTFAGANANVYKNGFNFYGRIASTNPSTFTCDLNGQAVAAYRPSALLTRFFCN